MNELDNLLCEHQYEEEYLDEYPDEFWEHLFAEHLEEEWQKGLI